MIHVVFSRLDYAIEVSGRGAVLRFPALSATDDPLAAGHYRIARHVVHRPWTAGEGPGRIELADLDEAAVDDLVNAGRAVRRPGDDLLEIDGVVGAVGRFERRSRGLGDPAGASIRGGGTGADAVAPFQRLVPPPGGGARVHNADLMRLVELLFGGGADARRVRVFSVVGNA